MVMKIKPKDDIELAIWDEIETLNENIEIVASLLKDENIPFLAAKNAQELLEMLIKIKTMFENEEIEIEKKNSILEKLPLLYLQIAFIKEQIKAKVKK